MGSLRPISIITILFHLILIFHYIPFNILTLSSPYLHFKGSLVLLLLNKFPHSNFLGEHVIKVTFFQYSVKLGSSLLFSRNARILATQKHWTTWGVSTLHLKTYWRWIWSFKEPTKLILFRWLLVHTTLLVGHSLKGNVTPNLRQCGFCHELWEIAKHTLWSCPLV